MTPTSRSHVQLTEMFPLELLERVLSYISIPDLLRMKRVKRVYDRRVQKFRLSRLDIASRQVNRDFNDFIKAPPYTKYRIDLFAAGLEDNLFLPPTNVEPSKNTSRNEHFQSYSKVGAKGQTLLFSCSSRWIWPI